MCKGLIKFHEHPEEVCKKKAIRLRDFLNPKKRLINNTVKERNGKLEFDKI